MGRRELRELPDRERLVPDLPEEPDRERPAELERLLPDREGPAELGLLREPEERAPLPALDDGLERVGVLPAVPDVGRFSGARGVDRRR